jgi:hypothetical protein
MTPEQRVEWEAEVRSLYDGMVRIVITPTWVKLIDFETTLPTAVEELVQQRAERQRACRGAAAPGHLYVVVELDQESGSVAPAPILGSALLHVRGRPEHLRAPRIGPLLLSRHCLVDASQFRIT